MARARAAKLEQLSPRELQQQLIDSRSATLRLLAFLDARGIEHSGQISGSTLGSVAGVDGRTWRRWAGEVIPMPLAAKRAIICAAGWCDR